ncbi:intein-containing RctB family protein [Candidatus Omnitrophota bacterium]
MGRQYYGPLEKIDDYRWKIPKSYMEDMRVDGVIYASDELIDEIKNDRAPQQVANVATLPGIVKYSLAMPDIHWGYGAPIGGVSAFDIENGGIISPGHIGYDINCLCGNSYILNELGYKIKIKDYEKNFPAQSITCMDFIKDSRESTRIKFFTKQKNKKQALIVLTETGNQIVATEDHPFYTKDGMKQLKTLKNGDDIAVYAFDGIEYENPGDTIIADKDHITQLLLQQGITQRGNALNQVLSFLEKKKLFPIRYNSWQLPYLIKMLGYCFGDGTLYFESKKNRGIVAFYGEKDDLQKIKEDLSKIGFSSQIYSRDRKHSITTQYSTYEFERKEYFLRVSSSGFAILMMALGMPIGNKCKQPYLMPPWLQYATLWQKRLFLAGLFGAELSKPKTLTGHGHNFYCPILSMNKVKEYFDNGKEWLQSIANLASQFGVTTHCITDRLEYIQKDGSESYRLRLIFSGDSDSLLNLYSGIGFEYNSKRQFVASIAVQYLKLKKVILKDREEVAVLAPVLREDRGWRPKHIFGYLESPYVNKRFIERSLYNKRETTVRTLLHGPTFDEFKETATEGLGRSGMAWDRIVDIIDIDFDDYVYDFTVEHPHHNFIANNFVVSNCGVRLVKTKLNEKNVKSKIKDIVYGLYNNIPAGVGSKGNIKVNDKEEKKILLNGAKWALSKGYATESDIDNTEENGAMEGADPSAVSERAYERGQRQSGTLGSGNHFIEVQVIDEIYDEEAARTFGLEKDMVTVMIHSGSRGLGYQVCDDYARSMVSGFARYKINVPDRQLACAPLKSPEGQRYFGAMKCAANYAWNNRQCLMHLTRLTFEKIFGESWQSLGMSLIYDVAHNIAKVERHIVDGKEKTLCVHRKGATRAFGPGSADIPAAYKQIGQPVIIPGDMGTNSYLLAGTQKAMDETFGSTCHGAGRCLSRKAASSRFTVDGVREELAKKGISIMAAGKGTITEEAPGAYKDINKVVNAVSGAGISKKVCRMRPLGVIKG